jgi:hypothetical protein
MGDEILPYKKELNPDLQVTMEEKVAALIWQKGEIGSCLDEDDCANLGREIVKQVLWEFRKDLFEFPPKDKEKMVIPAEVYSDDHVVEVDFDALPWFEKATDDQITALAAEGWGAGSESDMVPEFCDDFDPEIKRLWQYISFGPKNYGEDVGTTCHVSSSKAMAWLKANRPELYKQLEKES